MHRTPGRIRPGLILLSGLAVVAALLAGSPDSAHGAATDRIDVYMNGNVEIRQAPGTKYTATVGTGTTVRSTVSGTTDASGYAVAYLADTIGRLHNGETVRVTDGSLGTTLTQGVQLSGFLDEQTGVLKGTARPRAVLSIDLTTSGADYTSELATPAVVQADNAGYFEINLASLVTPAPQVDRPAWRGYVARIWSRDVPGQGFYGEVQTTNATLLATRNHAGGGYFVPGDNVTFELVRGGVVVDTLAATANTDGSPSGLFAHADVVNGDVLRTLYHAPTTPGSLALNASRMLDLNPWNLTATVDISTNMVTGRTEPNAPVVGVYYGPSGQKYVQHRAAADGTFSLFPDLKDGSSVDLVGNVLVTVWRVAEPGFTGVGIQEVEIRTPWLQVNTTTGEVVGSSGTNGVEPVRVDVVRNAAIVGSATGTSLKSGRFRVVLGAETLPGDELRATIGGRPSTNFSLGRDLTLTSYRSPAGAQDLGGSGEPGRTIDVVNASGCAARTVVPASGTWSVAQPGCMGPTDFVQITETTGAPAAAAGSLRWFFQYLTAPTVRLISPSAGGAVRSGLVTLSATAADRDDNSNASSVDFYVDGVLMATDVSAPFSVSVPIVSGAHVVVARAYDAGRRTTAGTVPSSLISADSAARHIVAS